MRQALHIFRKDIRYLRYEIAIALALTAVFAHTVAREVLPDGLWSRGFHLTDLILAVWAFLIARAVHAEALPGDRQFWITRPYEWTSLLSAKILFLVAFVALPAIVADGLIITMRGFPLRANLPGLVWKDFLLTSGLALPACAFAAVTKSLTQWFSSVLATCAGVFILVQVTPRSHNANWRGLEWVGEHATIAILLVTAVAILLRQYRLRATLGSRLCIAGVIMVVWSAETFVPWSWAFAIQSRFPAPHADTSGIQVEFDRTKRRQDHHDAPSHLSRIELPLNFTGLPQGLDPASDRIDIAIQGTEWRYASPVSVAYLLHGPEGFSESFWIDRAAYQQAKYQPVLLHMTLYLTLFGNQATVIVPHAAGQVAVPGVGLCSVNLSEHQGPYWFATCVSPFDRPPRRFAALTDAADKVRNFSAASYSPFPCGAAVEPITSHFIPLSGLPRKEAVILTGEPMAHFRRELDIRNIRLSEFESTGQE